MRGIELGNIKDYRENELKQFALANVLLFVLLNKMVDFNNLESIQMFDRIISLISITVLSSIIYIFTLLIDGLISSKLKSILLNLYFLKAPGQKIFSDIKSNNIDDRFTDTEVLNKYENIYKNLPVNKSEREKYENIKWYELYDKHRNESIVFISNRDYLLMRDIYIISLISLLIYLISLYFVQWLTFSESYVLFLLIMIFSSLWVARVKAKRFVYNVIAVDIRENRGGN